MKKLALLMLSSFAALTAFSATNKLNVLLILSDDLRDTVGCYGNRAVKTPNLDRLAGWGVRFDRAYVQYPVCNASRTSFLTGLRPEQTGVVNNNTPFRSLLPDTVTFPQLLRDNGWYAAGFGKIFHLRGRTPEEQAAAMDLPRSWHEASAFRATPTGGVIEGRNLTGGQLAWCQWGMTGGGDDDQPDGQNAQRAIRTIEKCAAEHRPWLVAAGFHRPHDPFLSPKKYFDMYPPGSLKLYRDPTNMTPVPPLSMPGGGFAQAFDAFTDKEREEFLRAYYAGVSFMDAQVGRLLDTLERLNLRDNTLVIFAGDNGYHHNERNWWNKNTLFERSCRVPLIIAAPGLKGGQVCRSMVELVDLYPTVNDYCGLAAPHKLAGRSLRPLLSDPTRKRQDAAFTLVTRGPGKYGQTVRTESWRYTKWSDGTAELYNEIEDPEENQDLVSKSKYASIVRELQAQLDRIGPFQGIETVEPRKKRARR